MSGLHFCGNNNFFPKNLIPGCQFKKLLYCLGHKRRSPTRSGFEGLSSNLPRLPLSAPIPLWSTTLPPPPQPQGHCGEIIHCSLTCVKTALKQVKYNLTDF